MVVILKKPSYYTSEQLSRYLERLQLNVDGEPTLGNLRAIVRHHLVSFPFENTDVHYTPSGVMDVSPSGVFDRMVKDKKGGSYCFGQNTLLFGMLLAMGYHGYIGLCRVNIAMPGIPEITWTNLSHMILFLQLPSDIQAGSDDVVTYLVDCGFGGQGLARPIPLVEGETVKGANISETHRLVLVTNPIFSTAVPKWTLEIQVGTNPWRTLYQFGMEEYFLDDVKAASFCVSKGAEGIFPYNMVAQAYSPVSDEPDSDLKRLVMFKGKVSEKDGVHENKLLMVLTDELQRVRILRDLFNIHCDEDSIQYVREGAKLLPGRVSTP